MYDEVPLTDFQNLMINAGLILSYILIGVALAAALFFWVIQIFGDFSKAKKALVAIAFFVVVFLIGFIVASNDVFVNVNDEVLATALVSRLSGAGLISLYIILSLAILSFIYSEFSNFFR